MSELIDKSRSLSRSEQLGYADMASDPRKFFRAPANQELVVDIDRVCTVLNQMRERVYSGHLVLRRSESDKAIATFVTSPNGTIQHWVALVTILRSIGFSYGTIEQAIYMSYNGKNPRDTSLTGLVTKAIAVCRDDARLNALPADLEARFPEIQKS